MASKSDRKAFLVHLAAYVAVNAILVGLNAMQAPEAGQPKEWWSLYVVAGWGIGVLAHGLAVWLQGRAREGSLLADEDARGVAVHLFIYLAVNALLIVINLRTSPDNLWSIWPVLGWGAGLAAHAWLAYRKILHKTVERYATEQQILTQMQLERQAAEIAAQIEPEAKPAKTAPKRRKRAAAKKKAPGTRKGTTTKRAAAKSSSSSRTRKSSTAAKAKTAGKPASRSKKPAASRRAKS